MKSKLWDKKLIAFPPDMYKELKRHAKKEKVPFSRVIRRLIARGLAAEKTE